MQDLIGKRYGRLLVVEFQGSEHNKGRLWKCLCDCGKTKIVSTGFLNSKTTTSCGCLRRDFPNRFIHGLTKSPEHRAWSGMKTRCYNRNSKKFKNYGGRGIKICDRWINSFENFLKDMGVRPSSEYSLERKDVNSDYSPENCIWATRDVQMRNMTSNRKIEAFGEIKTVTEWSNKFGVDSRRITDRIDSGWNSEKAISTPSKKKKDFLSVLESLIEYNIYE